MALDAELVALRIAQNHPSAAVWPALVVDQLGTDAQELVNLLVPPARERHEINMDPVLDVLGLRHRDEEQRQRPVRREQQSLRVAGSVGVARVLAEPGQLHPELRQAVGISTVEGDALDAYGHGATFRRRRHLRLRSVSQLQEARKPTSTRVSHLLSAQSLQTARDPAAVSPTDPLDDPPATHWAVPRHRGMRTSISTHAGRGSYPLGPQLDRQARNPRLGWPPVGHDGEPPAQLDPHHVPQLGFQRSSNLLANVLTRPGSDN